MVFAEWDDSLSVCVEEIDKQHKEEIDILNRLHEAKGDKAKKIFQELAEHTVHHFATEEKYFDKFGFEDAENHKLAHKRFLEQATSLQEDIDAGKEISDATFDFIKNWLINHIKFMDQRYTQCFNDHGLK